MRVRWTRPTLGQLEDIQDTIARDDPRAAYETAERMRRQVEFRCSNIPK